MEEHIQEEAAEERFAMIADHLQDLARKLGTKFDEVEKRKKNDINPRMLEDYQAYQGKYSAEEEARFDKGGHKGSRAFGNMTRPKTKSYIAKVCDILYPTGETNFSLKPSEHNEDPAVAAEGAHEMMEVIKSQLTEAKDAVVARDVIYDGSVYGLGIVKGPIISDKVIQAWQTDENGVQTLTVVKSRVPELQRVRPWNFFPDMDACRLEDAEFVFERRYLTRVELQKLARMPGIIGPNMKEVLARKADDENTDELERDIREQVSELEQRTGSRYKLLMYHGPVSLEDLSSSGEYYPSELADMPHEVMGEVWIIGDYIIKMNINPLESGAFPYSVWCPEEDDQCIFGYSIPHLLRHPQKIRNSALRMMLDNAGLSVGPQIVANKKKIYPADGVWEISPNKLWFSKDGDVPIENCFKVFHITNNQGDLAALYKMAREAADDETNLPLVSQPNESGTAMASKTGVMSMVMNSMNVALRDAVNGWDYNITLPKIKRFIDWNMQFNRRMKLKVDCVVNTKGSSELLLKETQASNLGGLLNLAMSEAFAAKTNLDGLYEQAVKTLQYDPDKVILPKAIQEQNAQKPKPPSPQEIELQIKQAELKQADMKLQQALKIHNDKMAQQVATREQKDRLAALDYQVSLAQIAKEERITIQQAADKLNQIYLKMNMDLKGKRQMLADETKVSLTTGSEMVHMT